MQTRVSYICELNIVDGTSTLVFVSLAILTDFFFFRKFIGAIFWHHTKTWCVRLPDFINFCQN